MGAWVLEIALAFGLGSLIGWLVAYWGGRRQALGSLFNFAGHSSRIEQKLPTIPGEAGPGSPTPTPGAVGWDLLRQVLDAVGLGILVLDQQQQVLAANTVAARLLGLRQAELTGKKLWELIPHRPLLDALDHVRLRATVTAEVSLHHPRECILRLYAWTPTPANGSTTARTASNWDSSAALTSLSANVPGDFPGAVAVVLQEITELRRLEQYRREFFGNVSHELKTPLAAIQAAAETLLAEPRPDPKMAERFLQQILDNAERLHRLIQDVLQLARIEAGQERWKKERVMLTEIVQDVLERHQPRAEHKGLRLHTEAPPEPVAAWVDAEALTRILENLVDNALKYTQQGGITVRWHREHDQVVIEVEDTGSGIAAEHLPRIFERFYRVDQARERQSGGSGLGLAIVKHLVQAMDGSVAVESQPGVGSRFFIRLPAASPSSG